MKRILLLILIIICVFAFNGCSKNNKVVLVEGTDYNIVGEFTGKYLDITKRGYYIDTFNQSDAPYLYIICMGEQTTGGYSLKVKEVNKVADKTEIIVEEISPGKDDIVTMAITHPTVIVEFPKYQENIIIKNTKGEIFDQLNW